MRYAALAMMVMGLATASACSQSAREPAAATKDFSSRQTRVPGEYLVTLADGADVKVIAEVYGRFGIKGTQALANNLFVVKLTEDPGPEKLEELRSRSAQIKAVQPNFVYRAQGRGNSYQDSSGDTRCGRSLPRSRPTRAATRRA